MKPKFKTLRDGEWHLTKATGVDGKHYHKCCGCGLVHEVKYRLYKIQHEGLVRLNLKQYAISKAYWRQE